MVTLVDDIYVHLSVVNAAVYNANTKNVTKSYWRGFTDFYLFIGTLNTCIEIDKW